MPSHEINDFIAGAIGGGASIAASYPMDTIKVRLQTTNKYTGIIDCFKKMRATEGMIGFYKGMAFPLVTVAAVNSIAFGTYRVGLNL